MTRRLKRGSWLQRVFVVCVLCSALALSGCITDPATGSKTLDTAKISTYITYARTFNVGLSMAADMAATFMPTPAVQAAVAAAKVAISVCNAALDKLEALMKTTTDATKLKEAVAAAQSALETANAVTGVATQTK